MNETITYRYAVKVTLTSKIPNGLGVPEIGYATLSPYNNSPHPFEEARLYHRAGDAEHRAKRISRAWGHRHTTICETAVVAVEIKHREFTP